MAKTATKLSTRSNTPPCPGKTVPLSLTPATRFNHDSNKSPSTLTATKVMPNLNTVA